mmetsp:Transcript_46434/g.85036  ORF Transcript_46434/g.85036 Transcript_46434/m.85036 type:complete len:819 (-) Transcript_46434:146-2602(-)
MLLRVASVLLLFSGAHCEATDLLATEPVSSFVALGSVEAEPAPPQAPPQQPPQQQLVQPASPQQLVQQQPLPAQALPGTANQATLSQTQAKQPQPEAHPPVAAAPTAPQVAAPVPQPQVVAPQPVQQAAVQVQPQAAVSVAPQQVAAPVAQAVQSQPVAAPQQAQVATPVAQSQVVAPQPAQQVATLTQTQAKQPQPEALPPVPVAAASQQVAAPVAQPQVAAPPQVQQATPQAVSDQPQAAAPVAPQQLQQVATPVAQAAAPQQVATPVAQPQAVAAQPLQQAAQPQVAAQQSPPAQVATQQQQPSAPVQTAQVATAPVQAPSPEVAVPPVQPPQVAVVQEQPVAVATVQMPAAPVQAAATVVGPPPNQPLPIPVPVPAVQEQAAAPQPAAAAAPPVAEQAGDALQAQQPLTASSATVMRGSNRAQSADLEPIQGHPALGWQRPSWLSSNMAEVWQILQGLTFAMVVKALCMAGNVLVQVSPYPQVKRWENRGCTGEADPAPYVSIAFGGWQWCFYGMFAYLLTRRSGFLILVHSNFLGALLGTYYTVAFCRYCQDEAAKQNLQRYLSAVGGLALLQASSLFMLPAERALFLAGLVSSFCSFIGALSMLVVVPTVLRTQDSRMIPGPIITANLMSAMVWCLCGWMLADPLVTVPNVVSACSGTICLFLKIRYNEPEGKGFLEDIVRHQQLNYDSVPQKRRNSRAMAHHHAPSGTTDALPSTEPHVLSPAIPAALPRPPRLPRPSVPAMPPVLQPAKEAAPAPAGTPSSSWLEAVPESATASVEAPALATAVELPHEESRCLVVADDPTCSADTGGTF